MNIGEFSGPETGKPAETRRLYSDSQLPEILGKLEWSLGLFVVEEERVQVNQTLAGMLGVELPDPQPIAFRDFLKILTSRAESPQLVRAEFLKARKYLERSPSFYVNLKTRKPYILEFQLVKAQDHDMWGGLVLDRTAEKTSVLAQLELLRDLSRQSRKASAGAGGNLEALRANLSSWDISLVGEFLEDACQQLGWANKQLNLVLSFLGTFDRSQIYLEAMEIGELLNELIAENVQRGFHLVRASALEEIHLPAIMDPFLTKLALEYLLEEILRHSPAEQAVEISCSTTEEGVLITFQGSRTLPLPGMSAGWDGSTAENDPPTIAIARSIITAQGGEVHLRQDANGPEGGLSVDIQLPQAAAPERPRVADGSYLRDPQAAGRILLAEPQVEYQVSLRDALVDQGYRVDLVSDGTAALDLVQRVNPDAVLVARNIPGMDGLVVTQGIRRWSAVPVIMLSSRNHADDLVQAFEAGVDDYLSKPFLIEELLLRLRALLRRSEKSRESLTPDIYQSGVIRIDYSTRQVWRSGKLLTLTPIEYNLLVYLSRHSRQILTYEQLLNRVWEGPEKGSRQGLFVHVRRLRQKLEADPKHPEIISNKWGIGYVFNP
jgi:DNA-binding response OmpR family regulator